MQLPHEQAQSVHYDDMKELHRIARARRSTTHRPTIYSRPLSIALHYLSNPQITVIGAFGLGSLFPPNPGFLPYSKFNDFAPMWCWGLVAIAISIWASWCESGESQARWKLSLWVSWAFLALVSVFFAASGAPTAACVYGGIGLGVALQIAGIYKPNMWLQRVVILEQPKPKK